MKSFALFLMALALAGCPATNPKEEVRPPVVADPPPAAAATSEMPDFGDPKPPFPAASKGGQSTREALLHDGR